MFALSMASLAAQSALVNYRRRKVGGIWFIKLGRLNVSFCVSRAA